MRTGDGRISRAAVVVPIAHPREEDAHVADTNVFPLKHPLRLRPRQLPQPTSPIPTATSPRWSATPTAVLKSLTRVTDPTTGAAPTWSFDYSTPWQTKVTDANDVD